MQIIANKHFSFYGAVAYTDAKYLKFTNAPLPLEETGLTKDGSRWRSRISVENFQVFPVGCFDWW